MAGGRGYPERNRANALDSGATVWFEDSGSHGGRTTLRACAWFGKAVHVVIDGLIEPSDVAARIEAEKVRVLNVAGNRGSTEPGIGERFERFERFLIAVFGRLAGR